MKRKYGFLEWLGLKNTPDWKVARPLGHFFSVILAILYVIALIATFTILIGTIKDVGVEGRGSLGAGALIVAILGSPFLIWRTLIGHRDVEFKKEGHITDRISKAVEQLGSEKTRVRLGRPASVYFGTPVEKVLLLKDGEKHNLANAIETEVRQLTKVPDVRQFSFRVWPYSRVVIDYADQAIEIEPTDYVQEIEKWQNCSETVPNLEMRVGAILALERIAQDSSRYDHGRDHPRVMEIIAAYVRENSKSAYGKLRGDITCSGAYRIDLQTALDVIGRRSDEQRTQERCSSFRINLQGGWYIAASFDGGDFSNVVLIDSHFKVSSFREATLTGTWFARSTFQDCVFIRANISKTHFLDCEFSTAAVDATTGTPFDGSVLSILVHGADLSALNAEEFRNLGHRVFGSWDTCVSDVRGELEEIKSLQIKRFTQTGEVLPPCAQLEKSPYAYWSPFHANEARTVAFMEYFLNIAK